MTFHIIGGDRRQLYLADYIRAKGFSVGCSYLGKAGAPDWEADVLILPLPCSRDQKNLFTPLAKESISLSAVFEAARNRIIFGGMLPAAAPAQAIDYYAAEELLISNAAATAEAAIGLAIAEAPITLLGNPALVLGAGRIGRLLALRLLAMGAQVTVGARRAESLSQCRALGADARLYEDLNWGRYPLIFNTVPHLILDEDRLRKIQKGALLMELASAPGGFDFEAASALGLRPLAAGGLPGRFSPATAACALGEFIIKEIENHA